jgi:hypothetical protein
MAKNERFSPKSSAQGTSRKTSVNAIPINTTQDYDFRNTQSYARYTDEDNLLMEDDPDASNPPRPASSAVRLNRPAPATRKSGREVNTETQTRRGVQAPNVPARSTRKPDLGQFPPTAAHPTWNTTTAYDAAPPRKRDLRRMHWLLYIGLGMIAALALWALGSSALAWGTDQYNNIVYGNPRTFQIDMVVGHNDSPAHPSHFMALNLHGQVIIFELPGGDPSKAIDYTGPDLVGTNPDQIPVTLSFSDVNGDHMLDMLVHVEDKVIVFLNNGTKFVPPNQPSS